MKMFASKLTCTGFFECGAQIITQIRASMCSFELNTTIGYSSPVSAIKWYRSIYIYKYICYLYKIDIRFLKSLT